MPATLDAAASAIASAPRRALIDRLSEGPAPVTALAELLEISVPAVLKHVDRLAEGGIVRRTKTGRVVTVTLVPGSLDDLVEWATRTRLFWTNQLDRYASHVRQTDEGTPR